MKKLYINLGYDSILAVHGLMNRLELQLSRKVLDNIGFKVGLELFVNEGPSSVRQFMALGWDVFLDLRIYDTPDTVNRAIETAIVLGAQSATIMVTPDAGQMIRTLVTNFSQDITLVGITQLTSSAYGIKKTSYPLARTASIAGLTHVICPVEAIPHMHGMNCICPGIRLAGQDKNDHIHSATPAQARLGHATSIIMGRPITDSPEPEKVIKEALTQFQGFPMDWLKSVDRAGHEE